MCDDGDEVSLLDERSGPVLMESIFPRLWGAPSREPSSVDRKITCKAHPQNGDAERSEVNSTETLILTSCMRSLLQAR